MIIVLDTNVAGFANKPIAPVFRHSRAGGNPAKPPHSESRIKSAMTVD